VRDDWVCDRRSSSSGTGVSRIHLQEGVHIELDAQGISYESEKAITVPYRGLQIHGQRVDLIVKNLIVVELKAVARFDDVHQAHVTSYLKAAGLRGGLLINFRVPVLKAGLKRVVL
jgi:GxxExxY protein